MSAAAQAQQPFSVRLVVGLIAAGLVAFAALVFLLAYGSRIAPVHGEGAPALSVAATGYKGLITLVGRFRQTAWCAARATLRPRICWSSRWRRRTGPRTSPGCSSCGAGGRPC